MKNVIAQLMKVQEIDAEIYASRQILEEAPSEIRILDEQLQSERSALQGIQKEVKSVLLKQKEKEGALSDKESGIKKLDSQLAQVKTNKEYSTILSEISNMKADASLLEDDIIRLFDQVENLQSQMKEEEKKLAGIEKDFETKKVAVEKKANEAKQKIDTLSQQKKELMVSINPEVSALYEKIVVRKNGLALAKIDGEECSACQMRLRAQQINEVQLGEAVVLCEQCSRILYLP